MWLYETDSLETWMERLSRYLIVEVIFDEKERGQSDLSGVDGYQWQNKSLGDVL